MKLHLRPVLTALLLAAHARAGEHFVAALPGGTTCTPRVARPYGSLPGENGPCPQTALESSQPSAGDLNGPALVFGPSNVLAPPLITIAGKGHAPRGAKGGFNANRKAPDVGGRAVRRLK